MLLNRQRKNRMLLNRQRWSTYAFVYLRTTLDVVPQVLQMLNSSTVVRIIDFE